jgi:hypothetical protein
VPLKTYFVHRFQQMQVVNCIVCSLVMGLILDRFVNLETQCIIAINRGVSDVNNQDKLIYYVVKTIAYITLGFIVINLLVLLV